MRRLSFFLTICLTLILHSALFGQTTADTVVTLKQCVDYALRNQPAVRQASIDEQINEKNIRIGLADWLPQITSVDLYQHYFQGSSAAAAADPAALASGQNLSEFSTLNLQLNQVLYNNDVLQAAKAANYSRSYYKQNTQSSQINVVSDVSKAFFDVLLSQKQLDILNEDIVRLKRSLKDAYDRYQAGVADKTDYKQATISLNNSIAQRKQTAEAINSKLAYLKQIMGISRGRNLTLSYDSSRYEQEASIDTLQKLDVNNRIEYKLLQTQKNIENVSVSYYKWGFLPSLSLQGSYNLFYLSNRLSSLYNSDIPNSYAGLTLNIPIFTGTKRLQNLSKARLQVSRTDLDIENTENTINTEYVQALAAYKSNYTNYLLVNQNVGLARDVYKVVSLQYREGIKTYLDVIVAQSDLRTAELNYYNALFQLLSSKIDLEKALGILNVP
ncbi:MAG TPA: TolC family protein [Mucilaginibacter sp.]|jgi:outer membrane protein TolC|nr:TolC family protein [Mucilaginibacter sp.]